MELTVKVDSSGLAEFGIRTRGQLNTATSRAMNVAAKAMKVRLFDEIKADKIKQVNLLKRVYISKARYRKAESNWFAGVSIVSGVTSVHRLLPKRYAVTTPIRGRGGQTYTDTRYQVYANTGPRGAKRFVPFAFIAKGRNGQRLVFQREDQRDTKRGAKLIVSKVDLGEFDYFGSKPGFKEKLISHGNAAFNAAFGTQFTKQVKANT